MFNTSVKKIDGPATLQLSGEFTGIKEEVEEIRDAFRQGSILDSSTEIHLVTTPTFYANGQSAFLARTIRNIARGKQIICRDPKLFEVAHFFQRTQI
jgi:hypothetical protein